MIEQEHSSGSETADCSQPRPLRRRLLRLLRGCVMMVFAFMMAIPLLCTLAVKIHYWSLPVENRDGSSMEEAIIVHAENEWEGVRTEWAYTWHHTSPIASELLDQRVVFQDGKTYDVMRFRNASGEIEVFWFDVTEWYGVLPPDA